MGFNVKRYIRNTKYIGGIDSGKIQEAAIILESALLSINSWADLCDAYGDFDLDKCELEIANAFTEDAGDGEMYFTIGNATNLNLGDEFVESNLYKLCTTKIMYDGSAEFEDEVQRGFLYIGKFENGWGCTGILGRSGNLVGEGYNLTPEGLYKEEELIKPWSRGYIE